MAPCVVWVFAVSAERRGDGGSLPGRRGRFVLRSSSSSETGLAWPVGAKGLTGVGDWLVQFIELSKNSLGIEELPQVTAEPGNEGTRGASEGTKKSMGSMQHVQYMRDGRMKRIVSL